MISNIQISPPRQSAAKLRVASIGVSPMVTESAYLEKSGVFTKFKTSPAGLTKAEAEERLIEHGPNAVALEKQRGWLWRLFKATRNLLVILLAILATVVARPQIQHSPHLVVSGFPTTRRDRAALRTPPGNSLGANAPIHARILRRCDLAKMAKGMLAKALFPSGQLGAPSCAALAAPSVQGISDLTP
jgi:hypothetical protein